MVTSATRRRLLIFTLILVLLWQLIRYFLQFGYFTTEDVIYRSSGAPILVMVFYEALCPDSKIFILKQLQSAYHKAPELIEIQFVPYGKATTIINSNSIKFECQHGPLECEANMYHACAIEAIDDPKTRLDVVSCMIRDNRLPKEAMQKCTREFKVEVAELIQKCVDSPHGAELLKLHGEATNALRPKMSFIPTITLDGSQGRQASILKDLFGEICKIAGNKGSQSDVCKKD